MKLAISWEMEPAELVKFFKYKNWGYASSDLGFGVPTEKSFDTLLSGLYKDILAMEWEEDDFVKVADRGRLMVTRYESETFEGEGSSVLDIWLHVGHMHDRDGEDDLD